MFGSYGLAVACGSLYLNGGVGADSDKGPESCLAVFIRLNLGRSMVVWQL